MRTDRMQRLLAVCGAFVLSACGAHYAQVPARLQLEPYGRIALVTFSHRPLGRLARGAGHPPLRRGAAREPVERRAAGARPHRLHGAASRAPPVTRPRWRRPSARTATSRPCSWANLKMSSVKPRGVVASVRDLQAGAEVSGQLTVSLVSASTGGTVWRSSAPRAGTSGHDRRCPTRTRRSPCAIPARPRRDRARAGERRRPTTSGPPGSGSRARGGGHRPPPSSVPRLPSRSSRPPSP